VLLVVLTFISVLVVVVSIIHEKLRILFVFLPISILLLFLIAISAWEDIESKRSAGSGIVLDALNQEIETTDIYIIEKIRTGKDYEKFEVAVDGSLIEVILIDVESGEKRVVVKD